MRLNPPSLHVFMWTLLSLAAMLTGACDRGGGGAAPSSADSKQPVIGVAFETLQTEAWVFGFDRIKEELAKRGATVLEAVADNDANRQLEQVNNFIAKGVDGIILVPKDKETAMAMIGAANAANIPIVLFNRPPADPNANCTTVVADNVGITRRTVEYMCELAKKTGKKQKAMLLMGDLGDINAVGRRDGFEQAVQKYPDVIDVVARVPTEWNQERARQGVAAAFQTNPDISFIFTSSDFLFPSIVAELKGRDRYKKVGEEGHVILGGFDGDQTAYQMLVDGYLDADGVQDFDWEAREAVRAVLELVEGKEVPKVIPDPGFVAHQGNLEEAKERMWGAKVAMKQQ